MWHLAVFGAVLGIFHLSEFALAAVYMRDQLSRRCASDAGAAAHSHLHTPHSLSHIHTPTAAAFLFSWPYIAAMSAGVAEYLLECRLWPQLKRQEWVACLGLLLVVLGESIRKLAMVSCITVSRISSCICTSSSV